MGQPICPNQGIALAFPDVCLTPSGPAMVPVPYPNIAQLSAAQNVADQLLLGSGMTALLMDSSVANSSGDEAGTGMGVTQPFVMGECKVTGASATVLYGGRGIARFGDPTSQNGGNAHGSLLGAFPTVLVGG